MRKPPWQRTTKAAQSQSVHIETLVDGDGPPFVILPSYGRDSFDDFDSLTSSLVEAGWRVLRPQPRGIHGSRGPMNEVSLEDLADDVALVIRQLGGGPALIVGHAFGNMLACIVATAYPEHVRAVVLAAASAKRVAPDVNQTPFIAGDLAAPKAERLAALRKAFFAPGHDPHIWLEGWYPETLKTQQAAVEATASLGPYWACGEVPILELIAEHDPFKPPPYWMELREQVGDRVTSTIIADASHALFPEQPDAVRTALLPWAERHRT